MITTDFVLPADPNFKITGALMIYDAVGNLVYSRKNDRDLVPPSWHATNWVPGEMRQLIFYWNGISDQDFKAAPGIYRIVVFLKYGTQSSKYVGNMGIQR
jgi:hypothetical protein